MNIKKIQKANTLQLDQSDCGVACLLSLIKYYGGSDSLERLRGLSGTTREGTTMLGLCQAGRKLGFVADGCEATIEVLINHNEPVILHVLIESKLQHYVVCYGYDEKNGFLIADPGKGIYNLSKDQLESIWISKTCLTLEPTNKFVKVSQIENAKKEWFLKLLETDYKLLWISVLLGVFVAGLGMAMSLFSQKLIDDILPSKDLKRLVTGVVLLAILLLARVGFSILREYFLMLQTKDFNNRVNSSFFDSLLHLPKPFFDTRKIGELVARLNDTQRIQRVIKQLAGNVVIDTLVAIISIGFLFSYSIRLGFISILCIPFYYFIIYRSNKKIIEAQKDVMQSYAFSESNYINTLQGVSVIKNSNKQGVFSQINQQIFSNFQEKVFDLGKINLKLSWQSGIATVVFLIGILSYTSLLVFNKELKLGELMAILGIVSSLLPSIVNLALISIPINEAKIAFNRMYEFASLEKESNEGISLRNVDSIEFINTSFRFAGRSELFKDVNILLEKGKFVAIVGESGSGKSTLGQILQRFYKIEEGSIRVNNEHDLADINLGTYRELIGVIPQEIPVFNGNVIDNIVLGKATRPENVLSFIKEYGFEEYFKEFPQGLATILGEEGLNLSGGQKQIIGLARALFNNPQVLILDEATAAMDRRTEKFTMEVLEKVKSKSIIFFISHRLNTLKDKADIIYILENKTIKKSGNHEKLLETQNFYSEYFDEVLN